MHPIICKIGPLTIYSYGLMVAIAAIVCSLLLARDAKKYNIAPEIIFDLVFWVVFGGIIGARIFYVILNLDYFIHNAKEMIMIQNGGLAWQGSFIAGALTGIFYVKKHKLSFWLLVDLVAPYIALGQSIGRI